ncbi:MAG: nuclear transport factor 2 family protein [Acidobacteria bacterium]|nr:nuclear transport factor 2 family protein [Acidobacteriota bacterium]
MAMSIYGVSRVQPGFAPGIALGIAAWFVLFALSPVTAAEKRVTQETLLDRIQIEDMLIRYYVDISSGSGHNLAQYFTEDAVFDVNGMISRGREAIAKMYGGLDEDNAHVGRRLHMLLNNPIISVEGDTATVWAIWSGVLNEDIHKPPVMVDQGREYSELVKIEGRWYYKKRYITSDSNLPPIWKDTYKPRKFR